MSHLQLLEKPISGDNPLVTVLELVGVTLEAEGLRAAATAVVTELAARLQCDRVSLGLLRPGGLRVEAISHSAQFDVRSQLVRDLAAAMEEAADQDALVVYPVPPSAAGRITRAHAELATRHGVAAVCSMPLASRGRGVGVLTLEGARERVLEAAPLALLEDVGALLGPILELQRAAAARPLERARTALRSAWAALRNPERPTPRLAAGALAGVVLLLAVTHGDYRIGAEATLEGRVQRAIAAGVEGYVAEANARAGDVVRRGDVLGRLDERDLRLERRVWVGRLAQHVKEQRGALAGDDRAQLNVVAAKVAQAEAQLALLDQSLARTRLVAPFDGVVVRGDLSQALGSPVKKGDVLFEVAPLDGYRIILKVDERDIVDVAPGQRGRLALSALPGRLLDLEVERISRVSTAADGRNYFRVEARLDEPPDSLRPGMQGIAKIEAGPRRRAWIWTHDLFDWLRLWAWSWWP